MEFTKKEIMEMCPKDIVDNRLMGSPLIEIKFEKDTLDQHKIIGEENI